MGGGVKLGYWIFVNSQVCQKMSYWGKIENLLEFKTKTYLTGQTRQNAVLLFKLRTQKKLQVNDRPDPSRFLLQSSL